MSATVAQIDAVKHIAPYRNKAHRSAFAAGWAAARRGQQRSAPYGIDNRSSLHFRRAWLAGFDHATPDAKCARPGQQGGR
jgi:ribosome modulation factor